VGPLPHDTMLYDYNKCTGKHSILMSVFHMVPEGVLVELKNKYKVKRP